MSLKKVREVKADKGFKKWDLIVYGVVILLVAALFIVTLFTRDTRELIGIRVYVYNDVVFEYDFKENKYTLTDSAEILTEDENSLTVKITNKKDYNVVAVDKKGGARVIEANCHTKDCVYTAEIVNNGGAIFCLSHGLKVLPYGYDIDNGDIIM